jgi:hypothetical protein
LVFFPDGTPEKFSTKILRASQARIFAKILAEETAQEFS